MNYETAKEMVKDLIPLDDCFFEKIAEDIEAMEEILQVILQDKSVKIVKVIPQKDIKNLQGRSVRLDALCESDTKKFYNVEVQIADNDDHLRRVRYNASCVTANITDTGVHFEKVPDLYVIYISRFDMFEQGKTIYHVEPTIQETSGMVDNGLHEIYVNTTVNDGTEIAELMQCFTQKKVTNSKFKNFQKRVNYFKEDKEGVEKMSNTFNNYVLKRLVDAADKLIEEHNFSMEEACKIVNITVEEYKAFKEENSVLV